MRLNVLKLLQKSTPYCYRSSKYSNMNMNLLRSVLTVFFVTSAAVAVEYEDFRVGRKQIKHRSVDLPSEKFTAISQLSDTEHLRKTIKNILIPRVVGSDGHKNVRDYITNSLENMKWSVDVHKFHETVPIFGKLHFHNIIAKLNPNAERYFVLACHYDSKYMEDIEFLGATDSAVPCAMLLNLAKVLNDHLESYRNSSVSLMLLFFDGEEAFKEWSPTDSIYGARRLAQKWEQDGFLDSIDILMLLDLIGAPDPKFYSFFANTESWYTCLIDIEERLSDAGLMSRYISNGVARQYPNRYFQSKALKSYIEDDHIPFMRRKVPVLHLIPTPFPSVWHTKDDNESVIDYATTENIAKIIRVFTMKYLHGSSKEK